MTQYKYEINDLALAKKGVISLCVVTALFSLAFIYFYINYEDYSSTYYSIRRQSNYQGGLAPTIVGWGYFVIPTFVTSIFLLIFARDYKQVGVGIEVDRFLVNKDFIKATEIHFSEIESITENEHSIEITLKDYTKLIECQPLFFKVFARK